MNRISHNGYIINKVNFTPQELDAIKYDLTLSPKENHVASKMMAKKQDNEIRVYRENDKKMYIPRFYGERKFGSNSFVNELKPGENISVAFTNKLRDYQEKIISVYMSHVRIDVGGGGILEVPCGFGKTIMALNICSRIKKKTLVIVHKEFLMNQWIDRIQEFLPTARVGKIKGKVFDIEEKDIVIGMIQTMYDRDYPPNTFSSFGLTIIDEVHRIGSEEFSKTLLKVVTPFMLGISATVERKDGLSELIYMFIGDKIYSETRKEKDGVEVRVIQYDNEDEKYKEEEYDYRGNIKYSTMISRISDFGPRQEFIMRILKDLISENSEKQIMVLSHKRNLLNFLEDEVTKAGFASCGLYIGGMKQNVLNDSETKQIVLATYSMAAEALDIKTLNTLVMVSPKTDIIQSVGRILRTKESGKIIIDLVDSHNVFQNQWKKRKTFYKKSKYLIKMVGVENYDMADVENWKVAFDPEKETATKEKKQCQLILS